MSYANVVEEKKETQIYFIFDFIVSHLHLYISVTFDLVRAMEF